MIEIQREVNREDYNGFLVIGTAAAAIWGTVKLLRGTKQYISNECAKECKNIWAIANNIRASELTKAEAAVSKAVKNSNLDDAYEGLDYFEEVLAMLNETVECCYLVYEKAQSQLKDSGIGKKKIQERVNTAKSYYEKTKAILTNADNTFKKLEKTVDILEQKLTANSGSPAGKRQGKEILADNKMLYIGGGVIVVVVLGVVIALSLNTKKQT